MAGKRGALPRPRPGEPKFSEVLRSAISSRLLDVHTALPGEVVKYTPATGTQAATVDVQVTVRGTVPTSDGDYLLETLPVIPNVPIGWLQGGGAYVQLKLGKGDTGLLVFSEACWALWRTSGKLSEPGDLRRHDLSYPVFQPVLVPDGKPIPELAAGEVVAIDGPGTIRLGGTAAEFVALASKVETELGKIANAFATFIAGSGGASFPHAYTTPTSGVTAASKVKAE